MKNRLFNKYSLADLVTIYSFLNDYYNYPNVYMLTTDVEEEIINRFNLIIEKEG